MTLLKRSPSLCIDTAEKQKNEEKQPVEELEELRAKLKWTQGELEARRDAERQRQLQVGRRSTVRETPSGTKPTAREARASHRAGVPAGFQGPGSELGQRLPGRGK